MVEMLEKASQNDLQLLVKEHGIKTSLNISHLREKLSGVMMVQGDGRDDSPIESKNNINSIENSVQVGDELMQALRLDEGKPSETVSYVDQQCNDKIISEEMNQCQHIDVTTEAKHSTEVNRTKSGKNSCENVQENPECINKTKTLNSEKRGNIAAQRWSMIQAQQEAFAQKGRRKVEDVPIVGRGNIAAETMASIRAQQVAFAQKGRRKADDIPKVGRGNVLAEKMASIRAMQMAFSRKGRKEGKENEGRENNCSEFNPQEAAVFATKNDNIVLEDAFDIRAKETQLKEVGMIQADDNASSTARNNNLSSKEVSASSLPNKIIATHAGSESNETKIPSKDTATLVKKHNYHGESRTSLAGSESSETKKSSKDNEILVKEDIYDRAGKPSELGKTNKNLSAINVKKSEELEVGTKDRQSLYYSNKEGSNRGITFPFSGLRNSKWKTPKNRDVPAWKLAAQEFHDKIMGVKSSDVTSKSTPVKKDTTPVFYVSRKTGTTPSEPPAWKAAALDFLEKPKSKTPVPTEKRTPVQRRNVTKEKKVDFSVTPDGTPKWKIAAMDFYSQHPNLPEPNKILMDNVASPKKINFQSSPNKNLETKRRESIEKFIERQYVGREMAAEQARVEKFVNTIRD